MLCWHIRKKVTLQRIREIPKTLFKTQRDHVIRNFELPIIWTVFTRTRYSNILTEPRTKTMPLISFLTFASSCSDISNFVPTNKSVDSLPVMVWNCSFQIPRL